MEPQPPASAPARRAVDSLAQLEKRDWELWSIALILLTVFAGGVITFVYLTTRADERVNPLVLRFVWVLLFGLIALVLLLNIYLLDKKRALAQARRRALEQELELEERRAHALTDALTETYNRRFFDEVTPKEVRRAVRANRPLSVLLADIDDFRRVNEELGHFTGDEVLREVAATLKSILRTSDYIFRFGGDEFLILLPETNDAGAEVVTRRLHQALAARTDLQQRLGRAVTVTVGPATFLSGRTLESVIEEAEKKVFAARRAAARPAANPGQST